jgi:hypothetical protein
VSPVHDDPFASVYETSRDEKKGVILHFEGQSVGGRVVRVTEDVVELTSREFARLLVKRSAVAAVGIS